MDESRGTRILPKPTATISRSDMSAAEREAYTKDAKDGMYHQLADIKSNSSSAYSGTQPTSQNTFHVSTAETALTSSEA